MIPAANQIVLKAMSIDDIGVTVVELPQGTYLIDGEVVASQLSWPSSNRQVSVKDVENIRQITKRNILVNFIDKDGCELTSDEYVQTKCGLEKHINYNDILDETEWGSLEYLTKLYEEDKEWIENHIQTLYNLHFRNEVASGVLLSEVYKQAKLVLTYVGTMEVKVRSETSKREAVTQINKLIDLVNKEILEK